MSQIKEFINAGMAAQAAVDRLTKPKPAADEPTTYILALARSFPCLERKLSHYHPEKFDADKFAEMIGAWSHGEQLCALFVLNVWNPIYAASMGWEFDLFDFAGLADGGNRAALLAWLENPYYP